MEISSEVLLKIKLLLSKWFNREISDKEAIEHYQSLYYLGRAIARFHAPRHENTKAS